jgi:hypothetical protein
MKTIARSLIAAAFSAGLLVIGVSAQNTPGNAESPAPAPATPVWIYVAIGVVVIVVIGLISKARNKPKV